VLGDRAREVLAARGAERLHELALEHADLAAGGAADAARAGEAVPRAREREQRRAAAVTMGGEHRADAAVVVGVGADDDRVGPDAVEHRLARGHRQGVDGAAEVGDRVALPSHGGHGMGRGRLRQGIPCP
jgi:hypothetical protein